MTTRAVCVLAAVLTAGCAREAAPEPPRADPAAAALVASDAERWRLPGAFAADTTVETLRHRFGAPNVHIAPVPLGEGQTERGVVLFADDPARRVYVHFHDPEALLGLRAVRVVDAGSRWQLEPGVRIGMPASALVALNGAPVSYLGFDWDYGGTVIDWHGGRLADSPLRAIVRLRLVRPPDTAPGFAVPTGDGTFHSDDARYRDAFAHAVVDEFTLQWPHAEAAE